jgi:hypothetical protein
MWGALLIAIGFCAPGFAQTYVRSYVPAGAYFGHQTGSIFNTNEWQAGVTDPTNVYLTYGPLKHVLMPLPPESTRHFVEYA